MKKLSTGRVFEDLKVLKDKYKDEIESGKVRLEKEIYELFSENNSTELRLKFLWTEKVKLGIRDKIRYWRYKRILDKKIRRGLLKK